MQRAQIASTSAGRPLAPHSQGIGCTIGRARRPVHHKKFRQCSNLNLARASTPTTEVSQEAINVVGMANDEEGSWTVRATMVASCSADVAFNTLRDYENAPRIFSNIKSSYVDRETATENEYEVVQSCLWRFLVFSGTFDVRLRVSENPGVRSLLFQQPESAFMKAFSGQWNVTELGPTRCLIEHTLSLTPSSRPPEAIEGAVLSILETQTAGILRDLESALPEGADGEAALSMASAEGSIDLL